VTGLILSKLANLESILTENRGNQLQKSFKESTSKHFVRSKPGRYSHFGILIAFELLRILDSIGDK
jgi:hypothetical protein